MLLHAKLVLELLEVISSYMVPKVSLKYVYDCTKELRPYLFPCAFFWAVK